ncbi:MAG: branched-chain amino acid ABC transporter ATP-binding protein/permease [Candidatus Dormibacteraeota bacterium]|nr:branched-chain amino acid ABC transporter ATP-binding protein/permease [Candidatus Dormibacteraeota bacterium]
MFTARAHSHTLPAALAILVVLALLGLLPLDPGLRYTMVLAMATGIAAVGLDIFSGYLGLANFGQWAFVGIGAYSITALQVHAHLSLVLALLVTIVLVAALSAVIGAAMVQLRHFGAALTTFFFAFVLKNVLSGNATAPITGAEAGLQVPAVNLGPLDLTAQGPWLYWLAWLMLLVVVVVTSNYANSRAGRALRLVKQSEPVAGTMGVRVRLAKLSAFVFTAIVAAVAGLPLALAYGYLAPETFDPSLSITLFAMLVVGGIGSIAGPIIGAVIFTVVPQMMQSTGAAEALIFALIFLFFVIALPNGLFGLLKSGWERLMRTPYGPRLAARAELLSRSRAITYPTAEEVQAEARAEAANGQPSSDEPALVAEDVSVIFGGVRALDGVSFTVKPGTIHALVGPNGAGKTTFLNGVSGLLKVSGGRILVSGHDVGQSQAHTIRAWGVARTFQNPSLVPELSVFDNVSLGLYGSQSWSLARDLLGAWASAAQQRRVVGLTAAALRRVELPEDRWQVLAGDLSLGEQKVVDVARAIAGGSRLLLLDEPTSGLGEQETQKMADLLKRLRGEHRLSILVVAHNVGFVQQISDQVTVLDFGKLIAHGEPERVISDPEVMTAYLGVAEAEAAV